MKRIIVVLMSFVLVFAASAAVLPASAAEGISVYVTIANGELEVCAEKITVTDIDADGKITVKDALTAIHEKENKGGFDFATGDYGPYATMLWGVGTTAVGYLVNNKPSSSLADEIKDGDYVAAYVYTDKTGYTDAYSYFDKTVVSSATGEDVVLTLNKLGYNEKWETVASPVENAVIYIDGKATEYKTDANGSVTISIENVGEHIISAKAEGQLLVPPVCRLTVESSPKTGDKTYAALCISFAALVLTAAAVGCRRKRDRA